MLMTVKITFKMQTQADAAWYPHANTLPLLLLRVSPHTATNWKLPFHSCYSETWGNQLQARELGRCQLGASTSRQKRALEIGTRRREQEFSRCCSSPCLPSSAAIAKNQGEVWAADLHVPQPSARGVRWKEIQAASLQLLCQTNYMKRDLKIRKFETLRGWQPAQTE